MHHLRTSERFGKEHEFRVLFLHVGDEPLPERERLGMRIVNAEDFNAFASPEQNNVLDFLPEFLVVLVVVVERVDVFVLLGRVFGELDAAIRFVVEPFRVRLHIRVVGAAVECNVQRKAKTFSTSSFCKMFEVLHRSEFRIDIVMAAVLVTHSVRASRFQRIAFLIDLRMKRIVSALAVRDSNRVNRNKINRIKAETRNVVELLFAILPGG